jgi:hypothetical protein
LLPLSKENFIHVCLLLHAKTFPLLRHSLSPLPLLMLLLLFSRPKPKTTHAPIHSTSSSSAPSQGEETQTPSSRSPKHVRCSTEPTFTFPVRSTTMRRRG